MEISEKLEIFYKAAIDAATMQSESMLEEQKNAYQTELSAYEKKKQENWQTRQHVLEEKVRKEVNREVSEQLLTMKRRYHEEQEAKKELLFQRVEQKLADYRTQDAYREYLCGLIRKAQELAGGAELSIYLGQEDAGWKQPLEKETGCALDVADEAFLGGIRAVIPSKNILLDETFATRLSAEKEQFVFAVQEA
jgi:vacuolar-type H+-ATPase subunit E/Vma4